MTTENKLLHVEHMRLRWGELDALRHLNNVAYFRYFEQARLSWFETLGIDITNGKVGPILGSINCKFIKSALYPADVSISVRAGRVGNSSFTLIHQMTLTNDPATLFAEGDAVLVWCDFESGKSLPLPDKMRRALTA